MTIYFKITMDDANFSGDLPGVIIDAAQRLHNDYSLFRLGYDKLRKENNSLSLENNRLMGVHLKSQVITRRDLERIRTALEDIVETLHNRYKPGCDVYDLSEPYAEILKKLDQFSDQTEKDAFKILEAD